MATRPPAAHPGIGTLGEHHLHAALKEWLREPGDLVEQEIDGFVVDLVRGNLLLEIQTRSFSKMGRKLDTLLDRHPLRLIHPVAAERWIVKLDEHGEQTSRRKSPRRGIVADVCAELVSFPTLLSHPNFTLEVLLVQEDEVLRPSPRAWRRRGWRTEERRLLSVQGRIEFAQPQDLDSLLPDGLKEPFDTAQLARALRRPRRLAQQVAYCLRETGVLEVEGRGRSGNRYVTPA